MTCFAAFAACSAAAMLLAAQRMPTWARRRERKTRRAQTRKLRLSQHYWHRSWLFCGSHAMKCAHGCARRGSLDVARTAGGASSAAARASRMLLRSLAAAASASSVAASASAA